MWGGLACFWVSNIQLLSTSALPLCPFDILGLWQRGAWDANPIGQGDSVETRIGCMHRGWFLEAALLDLRRPADFLKCLQGNPQPYLIGVKRFRENHGHILLEQNASVETTDAFYWNKMHPWKPRTHSTGTKYIRGNHGRILLEQNASVEPTDAFY